eukprot:NODE_423_length_7705_cov_0.829871.p7 type:complete len:163 gc:universal NODE_423_length_7705_cov_0.829871:6148-5660(-)
MAKGKGLVKTKSRNERKYCKKHDTSVLNFTANRLNQRIMQAVNLYIRPPANIARDTDEHHEYERVVSAFRGAYREALERVELEQEEFHDVHELRNVRVFKSVDDAGKITYRMMQDTRYAGFEDVADFQPIENVIGSEAFQDYWARMDKNRSHPLNRLIVKRE